jgi:chemotaxis protein MotA
MDLATLLGIVVAFGMIIGGQILEGGHPGSLAQPTAAMIVLGGTAGAIMVCFPMKDLVRGIKLAKLAFTDPKEDVAGTAKEIVEYAGIARREGVLALEGLLPDVKDPFLRKALSYVVDGVDADVARDSLETSIAIENAEKTVAAKVWESAGGFCPTIGIIGAVLGLIHVMENLSDPSKLGSGIAVAFVATVYGVGAANIFFLPMATKMKRKFALEKERRVMIVEGVMAIQEGLNPRILEEKLRAYTGHAASPGGAAPAEQKKAA